MQHGIPAPLVCKVQAKIDSVFAGELAPLTGYNDIWDMLEEEHIVQVKTLHVSQVMCHMCNRETLGLNGHNVHKNGNEIDTVGCDPAELNKAACFECCPLEPKKSEQIGWNQELVHNSAGLLAPLTGKEVAMSVGTGHFTAWCRCINASCKTPYIKMADQHGRLLPDRFRKKDKRIGKCIDVGFDWRFFPWTCEAAWPKLPDLCQRALNASHQVTTKSTELNVMCAICDQDQNRTESQTFQDVLKAIALASPPCAHYITQVGQLSVQCAGGKGAPLVKFLDRFAKRFGESKVLGEEFVTALVDMKSAETEPWHFLKVACVAANLASPKVVDGIAKCLTKSDIDKMKGPLKKKSGDVNRVVKHAFTVCEDVVSKGALSQDSADVLLGKLMVRHCLQLVSKEQSGSQKKVYKDSDEIVSAFVNCVRAEVDDDAVDLGQWTEIPVVPVGHQSASAPSKGKVDGVLSLQELEDPKRILDQSNFEVGGYVKEKAVEGGSDVYKVIAQNEDGSISLKQWSMLGDRENLVFIVPLQKLLDGWSVHTGAMPCFLPYSPTLCANHPAIAQEFVKHRAFEALVNHEKGEGLRKFKYTQFPNGVMAGQDFSKGSLKLAPMTFLGNIQIGKELTKVKMQVDDVVLTVSGLPKPGKLVCDDKSRDQAYAKFCYVPYWWVETTSDNEKANMRMASMKCPEDDAIKYPVLQNLRAIKENERLYIFKEKVGKAGLQGVTITNLSDAADEAKAAGKKGGGKGKKRKSTKDD